MGQWSMLVTRGNLGCSLPPHRHIIFEMAHEYRILVNTLKSEDKVSGYNYD